MVVPTMTIDTDQRDFLQRIIDRTGWTITELANRAGLDHSTLTRFMAGGREGHVLRFSTIRKLESVSGLGFTGQGNFAKPLGEAKGHTGGFAENEAVPYRPGQESASDGVIAAAIGQKNTADAWVLRSRALEGLGYRPGDVLIVDLAAHPQPGDVVCAQVVDWQKGVAETVFRSYRPPCLVAVTPDESLLQPHIIDHAAVTIKGVVTHLIRRRAAA
jgi:transcriptional regulator with XRE-family HTH domain